MVRLVIIKARSIGRTIALRTIPGTGTSPDYCRRVPAMSVFTVLDVAAALVGAFVLKMFISRSRQRAPFPPGPKPLPVVGNLLDMPKSHEWYKFAEWGTQYGEPDRIFFTQAYFCTCSQKPNAPHVGEIVGLNLLGQPMIVLNSAEHATALLDKRGTIYSDRPVLIMGGELVGWKYTLGLTPYGERFREYRKYIAKAIGGRAQMEGHLELIERQTTKFLTRVLNDPDNIATQIRKCVLM